MAGIDALINELNKKHGQNLIRKGTNIEPIKRIPFSSPRLNYMTYGGIPRGRATELLGPENGGKTTTAVDSAAQAQKLANSEFTQKLRDAKAEVDRLNTGAKSNKKKLKEAEDLLAEIKERGPQRVAYVDSENTLDEEWTETNGVNNEDLILIRPNDQTAEEILQIMIDLIKTGDIILIILDSIPMLIPQQVYEEDVSKKMYGGASGALSEFCRRVSGPLNRTDTALIMINQIREDLQSQYVAYKTPGGRALKHLYALRLFISKGSLIDKDNNEIPNREGTPAGNLVNVKIEKTKVCKPNRRTGFYTLNYIYGIDVIADTVEMAIMNDLIMQAGAWFTIMAADGQPMEENGDPLKFQGRGKLLDFMKESPDTLALIYKQLNDKIAQQ